MNLAQEITWYSNAYWAGIITLEMYYFLCDSAIECYLLTKEK